MRNLPIKLGKSLESRKQQQALRKLNLSHGLIDFSTNDYLGFSASETIFRDTAAILKESNLPKNGATGSRLLSGNHKLFEKTEKIVADFHQSKAALIFNSGYDANIGFFSSVPMRGDIIFYDELVHASIRDGIKMSNAKAYKFRHNDLEDLKIQLERLKKVRIEGDVFLMTEAVFSMDGDSPNLQEFVVFSEENGLFLVVDEAHAVGVFDENGAGLLQELNIEDKVFARIITFGKALGAHGAAILGSNQLKEFLINFARSFIFTTALPPHSVAVILAAYREMESFSRKQGFKAQYEPSAIEKLRQNIHFFQSEVSRNNLNDFFISGKSAIHSCIVPGNEKVKDISTKLKIEGFDVKPILSPTVPKGKERLRFCLHNFNSEKEIKTVLKLLATFVK